MFINIQFPTDTQKGPLRRAIRSQAALSSADCRKSTIAAKAGTNKDSPEEASTKLPRVRRRSKVKAQKEDPNTPSSSLSTISSNNSSLDSIFSQHHSRSSSTSSSPPEINCLVSHLDEWIPQYNNLTPVPSAGIWHPAIPRLVDTYLVYFAPELQDPIYQSDRPVLRKELWPAALSHDALFFTNLLVATSHPSFSQERTPAVVAWFRHQAMRSVQAALDSTAGLNTSDQLIAAVCLLCGWEFQFGDAESSKAHMAGLKIMVNLRGGFRDASFPPIVNRLITFVTYDQPWSSRKEPIFVPQGMKPGSVDKASSLDLPEGFASFTSPNRCYLIAPSTLDFVDEIHRVMRRTRHRKYALLDIQSRLADYNFVELVTNNFCPIQTPVDDTILAQAEMHIKIALQCLVYHLRDEEFDHWTLSSSLVPGVLVNTIYAEMGLWALSLICSTTRMQTPFLLDGLENLVASLSVKEWSLANRIFRRYLYPADSLDVATKALWNQLKLDKIPMFEYNNLSRFHVATHMRNEEPLVLD